MGILAELSLPNLFELDELEVLHTLKSSKNDQVGILIAKEKANSIKPNKPIIRLYLLNRLDGKFKVTKELEAFTFQSQEQAIYFSENLPTMSALELILFINNIKQ